MGVTEKWKNSQGIWVFGYGSLCWKPDFAYEEIQTGYVTGFSRRFWQGNVTHRGTLSKPGLVATLIPEEEGQTWGCAYKVEERDKLNILKYLEHREVTLGGYVPVWTNFYHVNSTCDMKMQYSSGFSETGYSSYSDSEESDESSKDGDDDQRDQVYSQDDEDEEELDGNKEEDNGVTSTSVLCYIAMEGNPLWMREDCEKKIAKQVRDAIGFSGANIEYVLNLHKYMRNNFPFHYDPHLEGIVKYL